MHGEAGSLADRYAAENRIAFSNGTSVRTLGTAWAVYEHNLRTVSARSTDYAALTVNLGPHNGEILDLARSITDGMTSDYDKVRAIHDWVASNIWYDLDAFLRGGETATSALGVLQTRRSVCGGFANLMVALLRAAGIPARYVEGYAMGAGAIRSELLDIDGGGTNHAWTEAFADGRWIILETTWDSRNYYEYHRFSEQRATGSHWFDVDYRPFSISHRFGGTTPAEPISTASGWARDNIESAISKGFVPLALQNVYTSFINRAEFCRMAVRYVEYATGKSIDEVMAERGVSRDPNAFADTGDPDILAAFALGITSGMGEGRFAPNNRFSREQAARMLMNMADVLGMDIENPPPSGFDDKDAAAAWAVSAIDFCRANGIMDGVGGNRFNPKAPFTRQQSIITFDRMG
jgi:hypothetical protein